MIEAGEFEINGVKYRAKFYLAGGDVINDALYRLKQAITDGKGFIVSADSKAWIEAEKI